MKTNCTKTLAIVALLGATTLSFAQTRPVTKDGGELARSFVYDASLSTPLSGDAVDQGAVGSPLLMIQAPTTVNVLHYLAVSGLLGMNFKVSGFGTGVSAEEAQTLNFATSSRISIEWLQFGWTGNEPTANVDGMNLFGTLKSFNGENGAGTQVGTGSFNVGADNPSGNINQSTSVTYAPDLDDSLDGKGSVKLIRQIKVTPKQLGGTSYVSNGWLRFSFN